MNGYKTTSYNHAIWNAKFKLQKNIRVFCQTLNLENLSFVGTKKILMPKFIQTSF